MSSWTFDSIFKDRTVLQPSSLRMEAYRYNSAVEVLGKFHVFSQMERKCVSTVVSVTNMNNSPNLLSRGQFATP